MPKACNFWDKQGVYCKERGPKHKMVEQVENHKPNNAEEEELERAAEAMRNGSAEAFHLLYKAYHQKVYRFCLRILGDEAAAKDAFQETFIKVYENKSSFRGENFGAWLFTIARRTCLNLLRSRKEHEEFDEVFHGATPTHQTDYGMKSYIEKSIQMLPVALREALVLREYEEMSYQEIAGILGIDLSLAKVRVFRARERLRKLLKPLMKELNES